MRRIDLVELLADLGLGQGMHSIIGQGKVEAILASKPEERRALIEEAAGLGRFKARRHRAELKLARVAIQVERHAISRRRSKRLRPLALQATAAERAEKLRGELARLRARIAELDLSTLDERLAEARTRRGAAAAGRAAPKSGSRRCSPSAARPRRSSRTRRARASRRCRSCTGCAAPPSASGCGASRPSRCVRRLREELEQPRRVLDERVRMERAALGEQVSLHEERLRALDRALAEREGLPPAARALAEEGERIALSLLDVEAGMSARSPQRCGSVRPRGRATTRPRVRAARARAGGRARRSSSSSAVIRRSSSSECRSSRRRSCSRRPSRR